MIYTSDIDFEKKLGAMSETGIGKLFKNGRSQAVRLPREFRFEGDQVCLRRVGRGVLLEPLLDVRAWFSGVDAVGSEPFMDVARD